MKRHLSLCEAARGYEKETTTRLIIYFFSECVSQEKISNFRSRFHADFYRKNRKKTAQIQVRYVATSVGAIFAYVRELKTVHENRI